MAPETELWSRDVETEELWSRPVEIGDTPENPVDTSHPDIGVATRQLINFAGGDPKTAVRYLQGKGYDAKAIGGFNFAVKKPEETKWQRLDSTKWEWQDVLDVAGDVLSLGGMVGGGLVGSPGLATAVGGSALGAAGMQGVRSGIGQMLGMPATGGEVAKSIGTEAVMGATAEVGGRILGGAVGGVVRKLRGKPPAAAAPAASKLAAGETAATKQEMLAAIEELGPQRKFGVEFIEKVRQPTTRGPSPADRGATRRVSGEFQKEPPQSGEIRRWADEWAEQVAGKPGSKWEHTSPEVVAEELYRRMLHGEIPAVGPGRLGPFVDVAKREAQVTAEGPGLVKTLGTELEREIPKVPLTRGGEKLWAATSTTGMKKFLSNTAIPHETRAILQQIIVAGPEKDFTKPLGLLTDHLAYLAKQEKLPLEQATGWGKQATRLVNSWVEKYTVKPAPQQIVRPLGEPYWQKVPTGSDVAFWRDLPIEGIQKLFHPDGRVLVLTAQQAKAAKVIVHSAATDNWTPKSKSLLKRLIDGLKWPKDRLIDMLGMVTNAHVVKFVRKHPVGANLALGAMETVVGGTAGGIPGGAAVMSIAGHGIEKVAKMIMGDTSGKALRGLFNRSTLGVPEALKRAAQAAGAGNEELYRAIMWTALKQTDVNEYLQAVAGSRGVNASGPRVRQGHGS